MTLSPKTFFFPQWILITHISMPLTIFYRFHSRSVIIQKTVFFLHFKPFFFHCSVVLSEIWKKSYKTKWPSARSLLLIFLFRSVMWLRNKIIPVEVAWLADLFLMDNCYVIYKDLLQVPLCYCDTKNNKQNALKFWDQTQTPVRVSGN